MVKAVIMDVDGVIIGRHEGINFPLPHTEVIYKLKSVRVAGTPIILCTSKFGFAIQRIIDDAALDNPHIADSGALIMYPSSKKALNKTHPIAKETIQRAIKLFIDQNLYLELYTQSEHYVQQTQVTDFTYKRLKILQMPPSVVESLAAVAEKENVIKMITFANNEGTVKEVEGTVQKLSGGVDLIWSRHPYLDPLKPGIMTAPGVSKISAVNEVVESLKLNFNEILAIGDAESDWNFMKECGYVATLENGDDEIKHLVKSRGKDSSFISGSVDDNGLIEIFEHFGL